MPRLFRLVAFAAGDTRADRVVPPTGATVWLTVLTSAAMAFLAVFALTLALATGRLAARWSSALAEGATIRISAPPEQMEVQTRLVLDLLSVTPGVASARALGTDETRRLLEPWLGPDLPLEALPLPALIEVVEGGDGFDAEGLRLRLAAEVPGATLDEHLRWREPLVDAAGGLRRVGLLTLVIILGVTAAMVTLAARAALAANGQAIRVLRLIGARDSYIARAFVRRFTLRTFLGAAAGTAAGMVAVALLPAASAEGGFLTGLGLSGVAWLWPLVIPPLAAGVAFAATRAAALRTLREVP